MKSYDISGGDRTSVGVLLYFEKEKTFIVELKETLDEWTAPLLFAAYVKKGMFTMPRDMSLAWVRGRIVPSDRQNIGAILRNHKLKEYDEDKLLELSDGRCSQDDLVVRRTDRLPVYVSRRMARNVTDVMPFGESSLLCFFADDSVRKIELSELKKVAQTEKILRNRELFLSGRVGAGGYYVTFDDTIDIPASVLYRAGIKIPLSGKDFDLYVQRNTLDTSEACQTLSCTRQNLSYLVKQGQLKPVKESACGSLYRKGDILKTRW